ncbi:MAG TPA: hypothetical protein VIK55_04625 [Paludibacter sp.]
MRKLIFTLAFVVSFVGAINAQVAGTTLGVRFANEFNGGELSFQKPLGNANRLELDLGLNHWAYSGFQLTGIYQWVWSLDQVATGLNWYAGLGGSLGTYDNSNFGLGFVGQLGIEYNFNIPLQISLDWRPTLFNTYYTYYGGNGLSLRYIF